MITKLLTYDHIPLTMTVGGTAKIDKIPITIFDINDEGMNAFNDVFNYVKSNKDLTLITRTEGGYISKDRRYFLPPMYDIRANKSCVEITLLLEEGCWRFQFRYNFKKESEAMSGKEAFQRFTNKLKSISNIDIWNYKVNNGIEFKKQNAPRYIIDLDENLNRPTENIEEALIWENVHHIDFHNSFPAGLANVCPEFRPTIEYFYNNRKPYHPEYKGVLNSLVGILWSENFYGACFSPLAIAAINDNNQRILDLTKRLEESDRIPLLWNTDGIWYVGDIYHGEGEGDKLGQWENDHTNCKLRIKSKGAYEYMEKGKCFAVVRGQTNLDKIKPREDWEWGDIFKKESTVSLYGFNDKIGVYKI